MFNSSTQLLTDKDISTLQQLKKNSKRNFIKYLLLAACIPFVYPFLPHYIGGKIVTFSSNYWMTFIGLTLIALPIWIFTYDKYSSIIKSIKNDLENNTKQKIVTVIDNSKPEPDDESLNLLSGGFGSSKDDFERLKYFCATLKNGDKIVIEYATKSKTLLRLTKE